jgi:hypothetical protein
MIKKKDPDGSLPKWGEPEGVADYMSKTPGQKKKAEQIDEINVHVRLDHLDGDKRQKKAVDVLKKHEKAGHIKFDGETDKGVLFKAKSKDHANRLHRDLKPHATTADLQEAKYSVDVDGLPRFYMDADSPAQVKKALRTLLRKASSIDSVDRVNDANIKQDLRQRLKTANTDNRNVDEQMETDMEIDEAARKGTKPTLKMMKAADALSAYGKKSGGMDKDDFMMASMILRDGDMAGFEKFVKQMDTDPRDMVHIILKKHSLIKAGKMVKEEEKKEKPLDEVSRTMTPMRAKFGAVNPELKNKKKDISVADYKKKTGKKTVSLKHLTKNTHINPFTEESVEEGKGLWYNIHKKRKEGRPMRKPGSKGAPTDQDFKDAQEGVDEVYRKPTTPIGGKGSFAKYKEAEMEYQRDQELARKRKQQKPVKKESVEEEASWHKKDDEQKVKGKDHQTLHYTTRGGQKMKTAVHKDKAFAAVGHFRRQGHTNVSLGEGMAKYKSKIDAMLAESRGAKTGLATGQSTVDYENSIQKHMKTLKKDPKNRGKSGNELRKLATLKLTGHKLKEGDNMEEGMVRAVSTARRMAGNMTGAAKKIDKMKPKKKGGDFSDNPRVQKKLQKYNENFQSFSAFVESSCGGSSSKMRKEAEQKLSGAQKKHMDKDNDGDIDASDLKQLRNKKKT